LPLIRTMSEDAYMTFTHRLLQNFDRSAQGGPAAKGTR